METNLNYIQFSFSDLPASTNIELGQESYILSIYHNAEKDFFTFELYDTDQNLIYASKLVYFNDLFSIFINDNLYTVKVLPYANEDLEQELFTHEKITESNFDKVRLAII